MPGPFTFPVAQSLPLRADNDLTATGSGNAFKAENVQEALEELDWRKESGEPTGFVDRQNSEFVKNDSTRTLTLRPKAPATQFTVFVRGRKFVYTAPMSVTIPNVGGMHWIAIESDGVMRAGFTFPGHQNAATVAAWYWDDNTSTTVAFSEERHGMVMDNMTHQRMHMVDGTVSEKYSFQVVNTSLRGDGTLDAHAQIGLTDGAIWDEDIREAVSNSATAQPFGSMLQRLRPVLYAPVFYLHGTERHLRRLAPTQFPMAWQTGQRIKYNYKDPVTGEWSLQEAPDNSYVCMWLFASADLQDPIITVLGQRYDTDIINSDLNNQFSTLDVSRMDIPEFVFLYRLFVKTSSSYTNQPKAMIEAISDARIKPVVNDRYTFTAQSTGASGSGKFLDIFSGIASNEAGFVFPEPSYIRTATIKCSSPSTGVIGVFKAPNYTTPILTATFNNETFKKVNYSQYFNVGEEVAIKVISGSFTKPAVLIWIQTDLS